ncbi:uncharacterized protein LOC128557323 [Mercenaria mercenaria]|uniref:uncharacterized protein LOC128557323 n=1 Tax=Mercenaria mercenaria TaxID=6596 RepID=UPI00234E9E0A|nr:uncharacterized protein LOC128557323 [Mercenaria mercenaria]
MDSNQQKGSDIARMIWIVGSPIVFCVGVFGNILTIIVLTSRRNKKTSSTVFLTFLAVADLLVMTIMLPRWWLIYMFDFDVRHIHNVVCKLHFFLTYFSGAYSAAIMALVTIERTICTVKPYKVKTLCNVKIAVASSLMLMTILFAVHGHILFGMKLLQVTYNDTSGDISNSVQNVSNERSTNPCQDILDMIYDTLPNSNMLSLGSESEAQCGFFNNSKNEDETNKQLVGIYPKENHVSADVRTIDLCWYEDPQYGQYFSGIHQTIATVGYLVIPEAIFFIGGIIIVRKLQFSKQLRRRMVTNYMRDAGYKPAYDNRANQITLTLLLVNVVFVVTATPAYIFLVGRSTWVDEESGMTSTQEIVWATVNQMVYINHAINFILYCLTGRRFRQQVLNAFRCQTRSGVARDADMSVSHSQLRSVFSTELMVPS